MLAYTLYEWLFFAHIIAAMIWVGGAILIGTVVTGVLRSRDLDTVTRFVAALRSIGPRLLAPATIAVLGLGVWMVLNSVAWAFGQLWVQLALGLFAAAFLVGAAHQSRAAIEADRAAGRGDIDGALRHLARWSWGYRLIVVLLVIAVWDMVFKPGL
jgi:uncharacterized membrane protein